MAGFVVFCDTLADEGEMGEISSNAYANCG